MSRYSRCCLVWSHTNSTNHEPCVCSLKTKYRHLPDTVLHDIRFANQLTFYRNLQIGGTNYRRFSPCPFFPKSFFPFIIIPAISSHLHINKMQWTVLYQWHDVMCCVNTCLNSYHCYFSGSLAVDTRLLSISIVTALNNHHTHCAQINWVKGRVWPYILYFVFHFTLYPTSSRTGTISDTRAHR